MDTTDYSAQFQNTETLILYGSLCKNSVPMRETFL